MKVDRTDRKWVHTQYVLLNGRVRKRALHHPRRERLMVRKALEASRIRYREACPVITDYSGNYGTQDRAVQWFDFVCYYRGFFFVIMLDPQTGGGLKDREKRAFMSKKQHLEKRGTKYIVLKRNETSQVYQMLILRFIQKHS